jgi:hypothetical protein
MTIASNFPAIKPSLMLDFANTKRLDPRVTFTRATTATYYDGVTTAKAEENLLLQSQDFTTTWTVAGTNATVTADTTTAPDGTTTADSLTDDATNGVHRVGQAVTTSSTAQMVFSVFAKYSTMQWIGLSAATGTSTWAGAKFDVQNGVLGSTSQQGTGWTANSSSITSVGGGWYRCVLVFTPGASGSTTILVNCATDGTTFTTSQRGSQVYTGSGSTVFIWGAQLEQRSSVTSYTATTTQPITNYIPVLLTAASGVPRFDHNPTTDESLGFLIEEQRTNICLQSEDLDTTWSETRATLALNNRVSPAGTLTVDTLIASTDNNTHFTSQTFTGTAASYTFSVYAKASGLNHVALLLYNGSSQVGLAYYNLSTGATGTVAAGTASIQSVGNGFYRCILTATLAASASCTAEIYLANADNSNSFAGDAFNGVSLWGMQVELGAFPTSYIATISASVTRNADAASMTGTNFSSWYNAGEGTLYAEINPKALAASSGAVINDNTTSNRIRVATASTSDQTLITTSGTAQATLDAGTPVIDTSMKLASAYKVNDFALSLNGGTVATDTAGTVPVVTQLQIGAETTTIGTLTIRKLAYYPLRVTDAQLQALTS